MIEAFLYSLEGLPLKTQCALYATIFLLNGFDDV